MDQNEIRILEQLDAMLQEPEIAGRIESIAQRVHDRFLESSEPLAWESIPLEIYQGRLPEFIRSSWIFILREGEASGAERHPNSHQRVMAWRGSGDLQIRQSTDWESHVLTDDFKLDPGKRWATIPVNVWHQAVVGPGRHWIVVSFHTATEKELIEERPDDPDAERFKQRVYREC